mmetsp:Transcript_16712/g.52643  ORF Transcript_16712/g.52643 Transcript_16712/m.52643 type:complete len:229 (+) Transcript_16712:986-1672(+)
MLCHHDAAASAFLHDEPGQLRRQDLDDLLDHKVSMRRMDRLDHMPLQLCSKIRLIFALGNLDGVLYDAATPGVTCGAPHRAAECSKRFSLGLAASAQHARQLAAMLSVETGFWGLGRVRSQSRAALRAAPTWCWRSASSSRNPPSFRWCTSIPPAAGPLPDLDGGTACANPMSGRGHDGGIHHPIGLVQATVRVHAKHRVRLPVALKRRLPAGWLRATICSVSSRPLW